VSMHYYSQHSKPNTSDGREVCASDLYRNWIHLRMMAVYESPKTNGSCGGGEGARIHERNLLKE